MQTFTQKYTIVHLLEPLQEGAEYETSDWPLHVTLADIFSVTWDKPMLIQEFEKLSSHASTQAIAGDEARFGDNGQVRVRLFEPNEALQKLHESIIQFLETGDASFNTPQFIWDGYRPHASFRSGSTLKKGDHVTIDTLTLIDMFPANDPYRRKVLRTVSLRH